MVPGSNFPSPAHAIKSVKPQPMNEQHDALEKWHLGEKMHGMWQALRMCHKNCGDDAECHDKCPKPWDLKLKKCQEHKAVAECHRVCRHDHACHQACPLPSCPHKAQQVQEAMQCHGKCAEQRAGFPCHKACPKPFHKMKHNCDDLEKTIACHKACKLGDHECHRVCSRTAPFKHGRGDSEGRPWGNHHRGEEEQDGGWGHHGMWHQHNWNDGHDPHHGWHHHHDHFGDADGERNWHHHHWHGHHHADQPREQVEPQSAGVLV